MLHIFCVLKQNKTLLGVCDFLIRQSKWIVNSYLFIFGNKSKFFKTFPTFLTTRVEELSTSCSLECFLPSYETEKQEGGSAAAHWKEDDSSKATDKQSWCASMFSKHKVTLVCFFKVTVSGGVTGLIKGYWLCAANSEPLHRRKKIPLWASALGKSQCWLEIRQRVPSILALSHWQYQRVNWADLG